MHILRSTFQRNKDYYFNIQFIFEEFARHPSLLMLRIFKKQQLFSTKVDTVERVLCDAFSNITFVLYSNIMHNPFVMTFAVTINNACAQQIGSIRNEAIAVLGTVISDGDIVMTTHKIAIAYDEMVCKGLQCQIIPGCNEPMIVK